MLELTEFLCEHIEVAKSLERDLPKVQSAAYDCVKSLKNGGKIFICGNGGSAADAQHFAAELTGRFEKKRQSLPAIALTTDSSALTAIANDYNYDAVFSRQLEGLSSPGDVIIGISTSGTSQNILSIFQDPQFRNLTSIFLTGNSTKIEMIDKVDHSISISSTKTARIQELHIFVLHCICSIIDSEFSNE